jgi:hypothetical protein
MLDEEREDVVRRYDYCSIAFYLFLWRSATDLDHRSRLRSIHIVRSNFSTVYIVNT